MTEYIIIVALIAIGTIAVVTIFGDNIQDLFGGSPRDPAGQTTGKRPAKAPPADR